MPVYVAMLRGVNLGPHKRMKMEKLRASFEALGFSGVKTYIQSGNVVFRTSKRCSTSALAEQIEECIVRDFGFSSLGILRSASEMRAIVENNPFLNICGGDESRLHVIFLAGRPQQGVLKELQKLTRAPDRSSCAGKEIYLYLPNGFAHSSLLHNPVERKYLKQATTRNWRTVCALDQLASELG